MTQRGSGWGWGERPRVVGGEGLESPIVQKMTRVTKHAIGLIPCFASGHLLDVLPCARVEQFTRVRWPMQK